MDVRTAFVVAAALVALVAGVVAAVLLRREIVRAHGFGAASGGIHRPTLRWRQLVLPGGAAAAVVFVGGAAALAIGVGAFGAIHVAYAAVAIVPPCIGATLLHQAWRSNPVRVPRLMSAFAGLLCVPPLVCAYATFIEPYRLVVERCDVPISGAPPGEKPIRIVVLADIQTDDVGEHEHRAIDLALAEQADLIVLPGDIFQGREAAFRRELSAMRALLARLKAPHGVFACIGNVDNPARTPELTAGTDVRMLFNEIEVVEIRGRRIAIGGVDWKCYSRRAQETFRAMSRVDADIRLMLCHIPDGAFVAQPADRIDLLIAGHTHGGQIVIPGFGPLMTASNVPREVAQGGLHRVNGQLLYVSRGVGFERGWAPPMRLFCPPEVSVLTLCPASR